MLVKIIMVSALALSLASCSKQPENTKLAKTEFKTAFLELSAPEPTHATMQSALRHVQLAIDSDPQPQYLALKATILLQMGHVEQSEKVFQEALAAPRIDDGVRAQITNNFACALAQRGQYQRAKDLWQELAGNPWYQTPEVAWVNLGKLHLDQHQPGLAQEAFSTAAMMAPGYLDAHYYAALAAFQAGNRGVARDELGCVLKLEPAHAGALALRGVL